MNAAAVPIENSAWNRDGVQLIKVQTGRKVTDLFNSGPLRFADLGRNHPAGEENLRRICICENITAVRTALPAGQPFNRKRSGGKLETLICEVHERQHRSAFDADPQLLAHDPHK